jgi:hypothetical protein
MASRHSTWDAIYEVSRISVKNHLRYEWSETWPLGSQLVSHLVTPSEYFVDAMWHNLMWCDSPKSDWIVSLQATQMHKNRCTKIIVIWCYVIFESWSFHAHFHLKELMLFDAMWLQYYVTYYHFMPPRPPPDCHTCSDCPSPHCHLCCLSLDP